MFGSPETPPQLSDPAIEILRALAHALVDATAVNRELLENRRDGHSHARDDAAVGVPAETKRYLPHKKEWRTWPAFRAYCQSKEQDVRAFLKLKPDEELTIDQFCDFCGDVVRKTLLRCMVERYRLSRTSWPPSTWPASEPPEPTSTPPRGPQFPTPESRMGLDGWVAGYWEGRSAQRRGL